MQQYTQFFVDGQWQKSTGSEIIDVINPYSEHIIASVTSCSSEDISLAVETSHQAFLTWSQSSVETRVSLLRKIAQVLKEQQEELANTIASELGMPLKMTQRVQVGAPIATFELTAQELEKFLWEEHIGNSIITREPTGVVVAITPWNYPLHQIAAKVAPAIASGCTVILKPSEVTPLNAILLAKVFELANAPAGIFNLVFGRGPLVGEYLVTAPKVDMISFTGSTRAGKSIMAQAAGQIKRVKLELGGKSASIILPGADLVKATKSSVNSCFLNSGQTCSALTRLLVHENDYEAICELAVNQAKSFTLGDPMVESTRLGPLVSKVQQERVRSYIKQGIEQGASLLVGGEIMPEGISQGFFVSPTILGDVKPEYTIAQEEIFGPVLAIIKYRDVDHAIEIANSTLYGLAGAVWGANPDEALNVAKKIRAGQVDINGGFFNMLAPFGGFKQSGFGRELGKFGIEEFLELKSYQMPT
jgi:betaine-aldehyde dehydrogenase